MDFAVIDVETANPDLSSICQVGIVSFDGYQVSDEWVSLVNPEDYFSQFNISIHGINEYDVQDAPTWRGIFPEIDSRLQNRIVVSHTHFDRIALDRACSRSGIYQREYTWLDSARVARNAWPEFSKSGYGLSNLAAHFGINYQAHDALQDARCAGMIFLYAVIETEITPDEWLEKVMKPIDTTRQTHVQWKSYPAHVKRDGNPDGDLFGEVLVFTGTLSIPRIEAANIASAAGCRVDDTVTKHTTILVVGDLDLRNFAYHEKSTKQLKAEQLIAKGQPLRIISESDFMRIVSQA